MIQLLRILAFPVSLVYGLVVAVRNGLYDRGLLPSKSFKTPIICIGNLSVGGTGKTPMTEFLISRLQKDHKIAVLSRGYKRKSHGFVLATKNTSVEDLGDEPYQISAKFSEISLAVDADRQNGISILENDIKPDIILLDDAFQHRKVTPLFSLLLTSYNALYPKDWYLPTGDLRDSKSAAKRANVIVVTKCPESLSETEMESMTQILNPIKGQQVLFSTLQYGETIKGEDEDIELHQLRHRRVTLVTGIANPQPLVRFLEGEGIVIEHLSYGDHHYFTPKELESFRSKELVLTTEKDYVRLKGRVKHLYYLPVAHRFMHGGEKILMQAISDVLK